MWSDELHRLAILELWSSGTLHRRKNQALAWDELAQLPWTRRTGRKEEIALNTEHTADIESLLDNSFSTWRDVVEELRKADLPVDLHGWRRLQELRREAELPAILPDRLNQRTASAALAVHSKATLSDHLREALGPVEVTRDGLIRLRPNPGLLVEGSGETWSAEKLAAVIGELTLTERALRDGTVLAGTMPRAFLLVENVGFYIDVVVPRGWLVGHVPGWNTSVVRLLLDQLAAIPVVHFGDLDPNGVRIVAHLKLIRPDLIWAVPPFWEEQLANHGQRKAWPADLDLQDTPPLVQHLAAKGIWMEQEPLVLDPRIPSYLENLVVSQSDG